MGQYKNGPLMNIIAFLIVVVVSFLGVYSVVDALSGFLA